MRSHSHSLSHAPSYREPPTAGIGSSISHNNSNNTGGSGGGAGGGQGVALVVNSLESLQVLVDKRTASWWYLKRAHDGSELWFHTVQITKSDIETHLENSIGSSKLGQRCKNFFILGLSLSPLFDIPQPQDLLKSLNRVLEEWESWSVLQEGGGGKGVKNLFRGQRAGKKSTGPGEFLGMQDAGESILVLTNLPFQPDYFQTIISLCEVIRQIYVRIGSTFASTSNMNTNTNTSTPYSHSNASETPTIRSLGGGGGGSGSGAGGRSPVPPLPVALSGTSSIYSGSTLVPSTPSTGVGESYTSPKGMSMGLGMGMGLKGRSVSGMSMGMGGMKAGGAGVGAGAGTGYGNAGSGGGGGLSFGMGELVMRADARLKKLLTMFTREMETIARKAVDEELALLLTGDGARQLGIGYANGME